MHSVHYDPNPLHSLHPLPTPCTPQVYLATEELGNSLDEVDALIKKHETVEKLLETQEQKASNGCALLGLATLDFTVLLLTLRIHTATVHS